ncbi:unnamed protein product [Toxocara canis]|uniref:Uncharacterized protein n=1 Tax=Toxocara canis TaxID=6265 RepID=A0A3P7GQC3_TOXCA|nr:unnamed protein product [Toxocara canis]
MGRNMVKAALAGPLALKRVFGVPGRKENVPSPLHIDSSLGSVRDLEANNEAEFFLQLAMSLPVFQSAHSMAFTSWNRNQWP